MNASKSVNQISTAYDDWQEISLEGGTFYIFQSTLGIYRLIDLNEKTKLIIHPGIGISVLNFPVVNAQIQTAPNTDITYNSFSNSTFLFKGNVSFLYSFNQNIGIECGLGFSTAKHQLEIRQVETITIDSRTYTLYNIHVGINYKLF